MRWARPWSRRQEPPPSRRLIDVRQGISDVNQTGLIGVDLLSISEVHKVKLSLNNCMIRVESLDFVNKPISTCLVDAD
jgi:hypothetical protein